MRLLVINIYMFRFLVFLLLLCTSNEAFVTTSEYGAKEGDGEVLLPCDYSQVTFTPDVIIWNELKEVGSYIIFDIVNDLKTVNGRYSLRTTPKNAYLVISKPVRNDSQRFQCLIKSTRGDLSSHSIYTILIVYYLDNPVLNISASNVYEGESVNFTCIKPDGDPVPNVAWHKDGRALRTADTTRFGTSEDVLEMGLHIGAAIRTDGGRYTCKAESDQFKGDDGKSSNQLDVKVIYLDRPVLTTSASRVYEGESVTLTCRKPDGVPAVSTISWYKYGQADSSADTRFRTSEDALEMYIESATTNDGGRYTCKAESDQFQGENGKTSNQIDLEVICRKDSQSKESQSNMPTDSIITLTAVIALVIGSVPTYLVSRYIHKRKEREIHRQYQNAQYQVLQCGPTSAGDSEELNPVSTVVGTSNDEKNKACYKVDNIYEDRIL